jgi:hypothetical protein
VEDIMPVMFGRLYQAAKGAVSDDAVKAFQDLARGLFVAYDLISAPAREELLRYNAEPSR